MPPALYQAKAILPNIRILGSIGNESLFRQTDGELVVIVRVDLGIGHVFRPALQAMLADHDGPTVAWLDVFRHKEDSVGNNVGPDVQHHFIAPIFRLIVDKSRSSVGGQAGRGEAPYYFVPD